MIVAQFFRGPFDGERLMLPTEEPWPRFVIPEFGSMAIPYYYLLAGHLDGDIYSYLYEQFV